MGDRRPFSIAECTPRREVDNRLPLKLYYRVAEVLLRQASIYRHERNTLELYILLLRYSSLVTETIPQHRHYRSTCTRERSLCKAKLLEVIEELEFLKPDIQRQVEQMNGYHKFPPNSNSISQLLKSHSFAKGNAETTLGTTNGGFPNVVDSNTLFDQTQEQLRTSSISIPLPNNETLLRHSYLGLSQRNRKHAYDSPHKIFYPNSVDFSPVTIPSLDQSWNALPSTSGGATLTVSEPASQWESISQVASETQDGFSLSGRAPSSLSQFDLLKELIPPPVTVPVTELPSSELHPSIVADPRPGPAQILENDLSQTKGPKKLHIAYKMMEEFMELAKSNTRKNIETCGVLAGSLKKGTFYVTSLIVPKQEATSDSCQTINEEEIFDAQDKRGLFQLGWIHTHPSQTCFMSSIDLHTHYSYQVMLPEAIAIVMAPTDESRTFGVFRLSDPGGVRVIQQCERRGFHPHEPPSGGGPIYEDCSHVSFDQKVTFEIIDLR